MKKALIALLLIAVMAPLCFAGGPPGKTGWSSDGRASVPDSIPMIRVYRGAVETWFGSTVEDRDGELKNNTIIAFEDAAPFDGQVTSIKIWTTATGADEIENVEFACFADEGATYATDAAGKATQGSGAVTLGAGLNTLTAGVYFNAFDCLEGEYIGVYIPNDADGGLEIDSSGGSGLRYVSEDQIPSEGTPAGPLAGYTGSIQFYLETGATAAYLLIETGAYLTTESGVKIILEGN